MTRTDITKEIIEDLYLSKELNMKEIADLMKCNSDLISIYINKYNIPRRTTQGLKPRINVLEGDLYDLYWNCEMSLSGVADALGCSPRSVARLMEKYNIPRRMMSEADIKIKISKEELHDLYWNREMNIDNISSMLGCNWRSVHRIMRRYGIKSREREQYLTKIKISKEELHDLYWNREMNMDDISSMLGCDRASISRIMIKYDINRRYGRSMALEKNPAWKGGISFEPYCEKFNESFKKLIREQFNHECFICGITQDEQMNRMKSEGKRAFKLSIHHTNYDKNCLCDDNKCEFIPLCISCHVKTNHDREYWEETIIEKLEAMKCGS